MVAENNGRQQWRHWPTTLAAVVVNNGDGGQQQWRERPTVGAIKRSEIVRFAGNLHGLGYRTGVNNNGESDQRLAQEEAANRTAEAGHKC